MIKHLILLAGLFAIVGNLHARDVVQPANTKKFNKIQLPGKILHFSCPARVVYGKPTMRVPLTNGWQLETPPKTAPLKGLSINGVNRMRCFYWGHSFQYIYISRVFPQGYRCTVNKHLQRFDCKPGLR